VDATAEHASVTAAETATARVVVDSCVEIGLEHVVGSALAFVNMSRGFLLSGLASNLPKDRVVLEVLEDVPPDAEVIASLEALRADGYCLALDDFVYREDLDPFVELASIAKLDISVLDRKARLAHVDRLKRRDLTLVAERVETHDDLETCRREGFDLFQGYFLARPATLQQPRAPNGDRLTALQTLSLLNAPEATVEQVAAAISRDLTLSYRLLRVINSAAFGLSGRIESLGQAILYLGRDTIRNWVSLLVLSGLSDKPAELLTTGLVRARTCEQLALIHSPQLAPAAFTAGLFSILDAVLDTPMPHLVSQLPLTPEISRALVDHSGALGSILGASIAYERCEWTRLAGGSIDAGPLRDAYLEAVDWTRGLTAVLARS
jgi:EAL and modified HD-GYP domain-containing signal transduction protein